MPRHWYIKTKRGKAGPITSKMLVRLASEGKVQPNSGVSPDGQSWLKAKKVVGLSFPEGESKRWYIKTKRGDAGPFTLPKLRKLALDGRVRPEVAVSCDGRQWIKAKRLPGIQFPGNEERATRRSDAATDEIPPVNMKPESAATRVKRATSSKKPSPRRTSGDSVTEKRDTGSKRRKSSRPASRGQQQTAGKQATARWAPQREAEYQRRFGPISKVVPEHGSPAVAIDVYVHPPGNQRPFTTLVTSGMSDQAMPVPKGPNSPRAELIVYVDRPHATYIEMLRFLAHLPHEHHIHLSYGSLVNNGNPAKPIFEKSLLDSYVLMIPNIPSDFQIQDALSIDGDPLQLLWVVPITRAERDFIAQHGMRDFCALLDQNNHSMLLSPTRKCYVSGRSVAG